VGLLFNEKWIVFFYSIKSLINSQTNNEVISVCTQKSQTFTFLSEFFVDMEQWFLGETIITKSNFVCSFIKFFLRVCCVMLRETHLFLIWLSGNCVFICGVMCDPFLLCWGILEFRWNFQLLVLGIELKKFV
jgi:hypothetical protein